MLLGKSASGGGLQVFLECERFGFIGKRNRSLDPPGTVLCGMSDFASVMLRESRRKVLGPADVERRIFRHALQNVHVTVSAFHAGIGVAVQCNWDESAVSSDYDNKSQRAFENNAVETIRST